MPESISGSPTTLEGVDARETSSSKPMPRALHPVLPPTGIALPFGKATLARMQSRNASMQPVRAQDMAADADGAYCTADVEDATTGEMRTGVAASGTGAVTASSVQRAFAPPRPCKPRQSMHHAGRLHSKTSNASSDACVDELSSDASTAPASARARYPTLATAHSAGEQGTAHSAGEQSKVSATRHAAQRTAGAQLPANQPSMQQQQQHELMQPHQGDMLERTVKDELSSETLDPMLNVSASMVAEVATRAVLEAMRQLSSANRSTALRNNVRHKAGAQFEHHGHRWHLLWQACSCGGYLACLMLAVTSS